MPPLNALSIALLQLTAADQTNARDTITEALLNAKSDIQPEVRFVDKDHWIFKGAGKTPIAKAARDPQGDSWIMVNKDAPPDGIEGVMQHEVAHLLAWDKHGEKIKEHGNQFRKICRETVKNRPSFYCKR